MAEGWRFLSMTLATLWRQTRQVFPRMIGVRGCCLPCPATTCTNTPDLLRRDQTTDAAPGLSEAHRQSMPRASPISISVSASGTNSRDLGRTYLRPALSPFVFCPRNSFFLLLSSSHPPLRTTAAFPSTFTTRRLGILVDCIGLGTLCRISLRLIKSPSGSSRTADLLGIRCKSIAREN